ELTIWIHEMIFIGQRGSRAFWQFGNMIRCVQPGVNPFKYNNYGSYCGLRRRGTPVDEVDLCCKVHDECYAAQMRNPRCRGFFSQPYRYQYSCSGGQPTCSGKTEPGSIFIFFLVCLVSLSTVCLFTARKLYAHAPSLLLRFW
uniref:Phospholipase A2 n=1 Tax=Sparus aurata TaxID=8175 RepID=A0A671U6A6_SPAAU